MSLGRVKTFDNERGGGSIIICEEFWERKRMETLFVLDAKNYDPSWKEWVRPSVRAILLRDKKIGLVYSNLYEYYKFAGGGIEKDENHVEALAREVAEEIGLVVDKESLRPYGKVLRKEKRTENVIFVQENYYYYCSAKEGDVQREMDDYEKEEGFELRWVDPKEAIEVNRTRPHGKKSPYMIERETMILERLIREGYFD